MVSANASDRAAAIGHPVLSRLPARVVFLLFSLLLALRVSADSFGRFGYRPLADLPDFVVDHTGVRVRAPGSDELFFSHPSRRFQATATASSSQTVELDGGAGAPSAVRCSLISGSVDLYFSAGVELDLNCADAPYLSWKDGSVGPGVPTPESPWLLVSYPVSEPPLVLGFSGGKASLEVTGKAGAWKVQCPTFSGWVRIFLPEGIQPVQTNDAASLGRICADVVRESDRWSGRAPKALSVKVSADDQAVDAEWQFDRTGAVVPPVVVLAQLGGYPVSIESPNHPLPGFGNDGPVEAVDGTSLKVHFPCRRIRLGRPLGLGEVTGDPMASASPYDIPSVVNLGLEALMAYRDPAVAKLADDVSSKFIGDAQYDAEPFTAQQLPYDERGSTLDLVAAHAFLFQASSDAVGSTDANALFDSISCRRDWWTWQVWTADPAVTARANALGAIAGAMSQSPEARLAGATLEAGYEAIRGLAVWRQRIGLQEAVAAVPDPLIDLRAGIFALRRAQPSPFYELLQSPLRVGVGGGIVLRREGTAYELTWPAFDAKPSLITFLNPANMAFSAGENLKKLTVEASGSLLSLFYVPSFGGTCIARVALPPNFPPIPAEVAPPAYSDGP